MLSLTKLEKLLSSKGMMITNVFTMKNLCVFLEVLCLNNGNNFFIYIQSKYDINADEGRDSFEISDLDIDESGNVVDEYAGKPDTEELENSYNEVDLTLRVGNKKDNLENTLQEKYDRPIELKDFNKQDKKDIKDTYRQLKRLKLCTKHLKYKLGVLFKNYFTCIRRDDSLGAYTIKKYEGNSYHKLVVIVDLETFYANIDNVHNDIKTVEEGVLKILDKNEVTHQKTFKMLLDEEQTVNSQHFVLQMKNDYESNLNTLRDLLADTNNASKKIESDINKANIKYDAADGLNSDIERTHVMKKLSNDLESINEVKREILQNILTVQLQKEDLFLSMDKILFDNNVMLSSVLGNIAKYYSLLKK